MQVTIDDSVSNILQFTVTTLPSLSSLAGTNFGIDNFAFNLLSPGFPVIGDSPSAQWALPSGWTANVAPPPNQADGFGKFDAQVDLEQGNVFFAARVGPRRTRRDDTRHWTVVAAA